jgi:hypothetical protein
MWLQMRFASQITLPSAGRPPLYPEKQNPRAEKKTRGHITEEEASGQHHPDPRERLPYVSHEQVF